MKEKRTVVKQFKTRNFTVYLIDQGENNLTVEYSDKRKIDSVYTIMNRTHYFKLDSALFMFNRLVDSCIMLDIEEVKKLILYYQNEKQENRKPFL
jgi:hypothetical protein